MNITKWMKVLAVCCGVAYLAGCLIPVGDSPQTYMVVDLSAGPSAAKYPVRYLKSAPAGGWSDEYKTTKLVLRLIPAGTFMMGSPKNELGRWPWESQHEVTLTKPFYVGVFEVTQKQWERVMGNWPSFSNIPSLRDSHPVEQVSYVDVRGIGGGKNWPATNVVAASSFMGRLRIRTGMAFDLPTEAQWEYAGRSGTKTALNSGKNLTDENKCPNMSEVGRYRYNCGYVSGYSVSPSSSTAKVGSYLPNQWGLYDIHGNVREWCLDWYGGYVGTVTNPVGAFSGSCRVFRGGSWGDSSADGCRMASRGNLIGIADSQDFNSREYGFRAIVPAGNSGQLRLKDSHVDGVEYEDKVHDDFASCAWTNDLFAPVPTGLSKGVPPLVRFHRLAETNISSSVRSYLVIDLSEGPSATNYPISYLTNTPPCGWTDEFKTSKLVFRYIPDGTFLMGMPPEDVKRFAVGGDFPPIQHEVTLSKPFYMGVFEVTQKQWERVMGAWPSHFNNPGCRDSRPAEQLSYYAIRGGQRGQTIYNIILDRQMTKLHNGLQIVGNDKRRRICARHVSWMREADSIM